MNCAAFDIRVLVTLTGGVLMYRIRVFWRKKSSEIRRGETIYQFMVLRNFVVLFSRVWANAEEMKSQMISAYASGGGGGSNVR